ncbi:MAG: hypothetical protein V2I43_27400 [Parvularcula sp.]|jgi:hypothetical protein|nr:hypothetical protein [Parvularcula sp.]
MPLGRSKRFAFLVGVLCTWAHAAAAGESAPATESITEAARRAGVSLVFDAARLEGRTVELPDNKDRPLDALNEMARQLDLRLENVGSNSYALVPLTKTAAIAPMQIERPRPLEQDVLVVRADPSPRSRHSDVEAISVPGTNHSFFSGADLGSALQTIPQTALYFAKSNERSTRTLAGFTVVDLRTLGPERTDIRLHGASLPRTFGHSGTIANTDLSFIPESLIGRVELVDTSRGATVGPFAVAGSMDIQLDRRCENEIMWRVGEQVRGDGRNVQIGAWFGEGVELGGHQIQAGFERSIDAALARPTNRVFAGDTNADDIVLPPILPGQSKTIAYGTISRDWSPTLSSTSRILAGHTNSEFSEAIRRSDSEGDFLVPITYNFNRSLLHIDSVTSGRWLDTDWSFELRYGRTSSERMVEQSPSFRVLDLIAIENEEVEVVLSVDRKIGSGVFKGIQVGTELGLERAEVQSDQDQTNRSLLGLRPSPTFDGTREALRLRLSLRTPSYAWGPVDLNGGLATRFDNISNTGIIANTDGFINITHTNGLSFLLRYALGERPPHAGEQFAKSGIEPIFIIDPCLSPTGECPPAGPVIPDGPLFADDLQGRFVGNPDLRPEKVSAFRTSLAWSTPSPIGTADLRGRVTYSHYDLTDTFRVHSAVLADCLIPDPDPIYQCSATAIDGVPRADRDPGTGRVSELRSMLINGGETTWQGLDFEAGILSRTAALGLRRVSASVLYTRLFRFEIDGVDRTRFREYPEHQALFMADAEWEGVSLGLQYSRISGLEAAVILANGETGDTATSLDGALRWEPTPRLAIQLSAQNILDDQVEPGVGNVSPPLTDRFDLVGRRFAVEMRLGL